MNPEIECRFLNIDRDALATKLRACGAHDQGEQMLEETICYDREMRWPEENRFVRLRRSGDRNILCYKEHRAHTVDGTFEVECTVDDYEQAELFLESIGLIIQRRQQKLRHTFQFGEVTCDIDTWPGIPPYIELEGPSEETLREAAEQLGLNWAEADFHDAAWVIEHIYNIPIKSLRFFTFNRVE